MRRAFLRALVAILLLGLPSLAWTAIQGQAKISWLGIAGYEMQAVGDEVRLEWSRRLPERRAHAWGVSVPTIQSDAGRYLGIDAQGGTPKVRLFDNKGTHTNWVLERRGDLRPGQSREEKGMKEGAHGYTFYAKLSEGPYAGWYLAVDERREGNGRVAASLVLVRDARRASLLTFVDVHFFVDHV